MFLIVGLGNPGAQYKNTRHNIGFLVIDEIIKNLSSKTNISKANFKAEVTKTSTDIFIKPQTFMNLSGESVHALKEYFKIDLHKIIVIHDDLDLPFGAIRFKLGGGHGGHNGLRSIDAHLATPNYLRVRIGIGKPNDKSQVANYVLNDFNKEEFTQLPSIIKHTIEAINELKHSPLEIVKSKYTK